MCEGRFIVCTRGWPKRFAVSVYPTQMRFLLMCSLSARFTGLESGVAEELMLHIRTVLSPKSNTCHRNSSGSLASSPVPKHYEHFPLRATLVQYGTQAHCTGPRRASAETTWRGCSEHSSIKSTGPGGRLGLRSQHGMAAHSTPVSTTGAGEQLGLPSQHDMAAHSTPMSKYRGGGGATVNPNIRWAGKKCGVIPILTRSLGANPLRVPPPTPC